MLNYEQDLQIDPHGLEKEWMDQPRRMFLYAERLAEAERERNRAKEHLDVTEAQLDKIARSDPAPADLPKSTETAVRNWVIQHPDRAVAVEQLREAEYEMSLLRGAVNAMQARKSALENLVRLHLSKYYSEPYVPGMQEVAEQEDRMDTQKRLGELMSKRKSGRAPSTKKK